MQNADPPFIGQNPQPLIANRYLLRQSLGKGTFGQVFLAEDTKYAPARLVAIKLLHPQFLNEPGIREDIRREASVLARFNHPNILRVIDFDVTPEIAYIVTDLAEGGSLANRLRPDPTRPPVPLSFEEVLRYLEQLCDALDDAHAQGLIHRDIKPLNILLDRRGRPLIADFGLAAALNNSQSSVMAEVNTSGTPPYMAPEQWMGQAGKASDIYALGIMTYQMLTGSTPFVGSQFELMGQHLNAPVPPLSVRAPWLKYSPALDTVMAEALAKDPRQRTRPALEFFKRFRLALQGPYPVPAPSPNPVPGPVPAPGPGVEISRDPQEQSRRVAFLDRSYRQAKTAMEREDWPAALDHLEAIMGLEPGYLDTKSRLDYSRRSQNLAGLYGQAIRYYESGQWQAALDHLRRLQQTEPFYKDVAALVAGAESRLAEQAATRPDPYGSTQAVTPFPTPAPLEETVAVPQPRPKANTRILWLIGVVAVSVISLGTTIFDLAGYRSVSVSTDYSQALRDFFATGGLLILTLWPLSRYRGAKWISWLVLVGLLLVANLFLEAQILYKNTDRATASIEVLLSRFGFMLPPLIITIGLGLEAFKKEGRRMVWRWAVLGLAVAGLAFLLFIVPVPDRSAIFNPSLVVYSAYYPIVRVGIFWLLLSLVWWQLKGQNRGPALGIAIGLVVAGALSFALYERLVLEVIGLNPFEAKDGAEYSVAIMTLNLNLTVRSIFILERSLLLALIIALVIFPWTPLKSARGRIILAFLGLIVVGALVTSLFYFNRTPVSNSSPGLNIRTLASLTETISIMVAGLALYFYSSGPSRPRPPGSFIPPAGPDQPFPRRQS
jgi:serine/threonine protein kinase